MNLLIIGAGGHGNVIKEIAETIGIYEKIDFVDDYSLNAIGKIGDLEELHKKYDSAFVSIGNNHLRKELIYKLHLIGYEVPTLIHPTAYVSKSSYIGTGAVIEPKAIINANSYIESGCIISAGAIVDHDVVLGECVHVNVGAVCMAGSSVKSETKIDAGRIVRKGEEEKILHCIPPADSNSGFARNFVMETGREPSFFES